jgi:nucleotide-binding universal stress UspA family protein
MFEVSTIVHPTDFSELSKAAFELAKEIAHDRGARLYVVHVVCNPLLNLDCSERKVDQMAANAHEEVHRGLMAYHDANCPTPIDTMLLEGDPATEIIRIARQLDADLIVMGTRNRRGFRKWFSSNVAARVSKGATCPVLLVKTYPVQSTAVSNEPSTQDTLVDMGATIVDTKPKREKATP